MARLQRLCYPIALLILCGLFLYLALTTSSVPPELHDMWRSRQPRHPTVLPTRHPSAPLFLSFWEDYEACSTLPPIYLRSLETLFHHHPDAHLWIFSNTLAEGGLCESLPAAGGGTSGPCRAVVWPWTVASLFEGRPGGEFMKQLWARGDAGKALVHLADAIRLALLDRYGGLYLDLDSVVLRDLSKVRNMLPTFVFPPMLCQKEDDWCVVESVCVRTASLATCTPYTQSVQMVNGLLALDKGHPILSTALALLDDAAPTYDPECWNCYGPRVLTKAFSLLPLARKQEMMLVAESVVFGFAHRLMPLAVSAQRLTAEQLRGRALEVWTSTNGNGTAVVNSIAAVMQSECFTQHLFGGGGVSLVEPGSIADRMLAINSS